MYTQARSSVCSWSIFHAQESLTFNVELPKTGPHTVIDPIKLFLISSKTWSSGSLESQNCLVFCPHLYSYPLFCTNGKWKIHFHPFRYYLQRNRPVSWWQKKGKLTLGNVFVSSVNLMWMPHGSNGEQVPDWRWSVITGHYVFSPPTWFCPKPGK